MDQAVVGMAPEVGRRRRWSQKEKQAIVALSLEPGCTVGEVAACFGVAPAQVYGWRRELRAGRADAEVPMFLPAVVEDSPADILPAPEVTGVLLPDHAVAAALVVSGVPVLVARGADRKTIAAWPRSCPIAVQALVINSAAILQLLKKLKRQCDEAHDTSDNSNVDGDENM